MGDGGGGRWGLWKIPREEKDNNVSEKERARDDVCAGEF